MDSEVVVRDPLMPDEAQGLICVGEVPKGSFVRLLNGTPESLIAAAARARVLAEQSMPPLAETEPIVLFIDCISRALFLGDRIVDELQTAAAGRTLFGAMTLGEIANNGTEYLEFYNKTSVLAMFPVDR
ncbi:FIST C-terminal domain-containing protein [Desulfobulbus alkaliphilus]|uniref:FIST C-terminal domain-containing protein n=1 Tax=Desulfobulbus alkaliphilus TaxID=869814 RepID=UPI00196669B5|nr:FIST C-terminal domain-containing protein [Desulfobulbus alkaliphilus]MBM9538626.1 FIST C-terminal domain-containing protein [Desulfobulbus alkaliphilus]